MCGISGFFAKQAIKSTFYYKAHRHIRHRGPDDEGFIYKHNINLRTAKGKDTISAYQDLPSIENVHTTDLILGHRRLAIIDLSHQGHQPFQYQQLSLVYNGELYNYKALQTELIKAGYQFETNTDTEVILKSYHYWGAEAFNKWNGMWALAIYDNQQDTLVLSRDRFGIKPLYYSIQNNVLYFASEVKFILAALPKMPTINTKAAYDYIEHASLAYSAQTMWQTINELLPAHYAIINRQIQFKNVAYWSIIPNQSLKNKAAASEQFSALFENSIRLRLQSDVEVGSLLSGGLDSTGIVSVLLKKIWKSTNNFHAFSAIFQEEIYSEKSYIEKTREELGVSLKTHYVQPKIDAFQDDFDKLLYHIEFPFRSLAVYSQFNLYRYIQQNTSVKVLLNGQGADELFAGYTNNYFMLLVALMRSFKVGTLINEIKLLKQNRNFRNKEIIIGVLRIIKQEKRFPSFGSQLYQQVKTNPLREYLLYDDRMSMAFGKEARVPFLDYRLVEFAFSLADNLKIHQHRNKFIVRESLKEYVPKLILNRKDKMGFVSPQEIWQRQQLKPIIEASYHRNLPQSTLLSLPNHQKWTSEFKQYFKGQHNNWEKVWRIYNFLEWEKYWNSEKWK